MRAVGSQDTASPVRLDAVPNNLPVQLTSFIGRESEIGEVGRLLAGARMVTLTGSGGAGKTRLALQTAARVADRYRDGVWWVDLAPVADPGLVPSALAAALSIREDPIRPLLEALTGELRSREALIVLDNCEHVVDAAAGMSATLLQTCPSVTVLATSRHTLDVEGETAYRVPSLRLPEEGAATEALTTSEAVQLFVDRALRARPNFRLTEENAAAVAEVCRRLDGIPLAIELAAARVRLLSVDQIASALSDAFRVLTGGARTALPRHQTLRASVEWSHQLLDEDERILLRRLSVFAGGFTLDAAEAVGSGDGLERNRVLDVLGRLVDRSLVQVGDAADEGRYRLLDSIRQYGRERLAEAGEDKAVRARHLEFFTALAERADPELEGAGTIDAVRMLRAEHDNIRTALDWSERSGLAEKGLRLAGALRTFWFMAGHWREARRRYEALLAAGVEDPRVKAWGLLGAATNCFQLFDWTAAYSFAEEALPIAREMGDARGVARAQSYMGTARVWAGDMDGAGPFLEEAVRGARETGDLYTVSQAHWALGNGAWFDEGDVAGARVEFERSLAAAREGGNPLRIGMALTLLGGMAGWADPRSSEPLLLEAVRHLEELREAAFRAIALGWLSWARLMQGDAREAWKHARRADRVSAEARNPAAMGHARFSVGCLHWAAADVDAAIAALEDAAHLGRFVPGNAAFVLTHLARARIDRGETAAARSALEEAEGILEEPRGAYAALLADAWARVAREEGDLDGAERLAHGALGSLAEAGMTPWLIEALELVAWTAAAQESFTEAARVWAAAHAARERKGIARLASQVRRHESDVAMARSGLGEEEFGTAWSEGAGMTLEEAVAYARRGRGERKRPSAGWASLTPTELEVAKLVADRLTNPQIGERLFMSRGTVKAHLSHIYAKLGIASRLELVDEVRKHRP